MICSRSSSQWLTSVDSKAGLCCVTVKPKMWSDGSQKYLQPISSFKFFMSGSLVGSMYCQMHQNYPLEFIQGENMSFSQSIPFHPKGLETKKNPQKIKENWSHIFARYVKMGISDIQKCVRKQNSSSEDWLSLKNKYGQTLEVALGLWWQGDGGLLAAEWLLMIQEKLWKERVNF